MYKKTTQYELVKEIILFWPDDTGRNTKQNFFLTSSYFLVFPFSLFSSIQLSFNTVRLHLHRFVYVTREKSNE